MVREKGTIESKTLLIDKVVAWICVIGTIVLLATKFTPKLLTESFSKPTQPAQREPEIPISKDAKDVWLTETNTFQEVAINENSLSGIINLPLKARFVVDAPGWAEYWFLKPEGGYEIYSVKDKQTSLGHKLQHYSFRMKGKTGIAKIQIEI